MTKLQTNKADFHKLDRLLQERKWRESDRETKELMLKICNREKEGWLLQDDYEYFPREELRIIDELWTKYSNGHFGLSVQKKIWIDCDGSLGIRNDEVYEKFGDIVGWRRRGDWLTEPDSEYTYTLDAPQGHLPDLTHLWHLFYRL